MGDNTQINPGEGGDVISTDDLGGGIKVQRVKVQHGADGSATDVSAASPLPVGDASTLSQLEELVSALAADGAEGLPALLQAIAGWDGTKVQALATDAAGILQVDVATVAETLGVEDAEAKALLEAIQGVLEGTLAVADATAAGHLKAIKEAVEGTLGVADSAAAALLESLKGLLEGTLTVADAETKAAVEAVAALLEATLTVSIEGEPTVKLASAGLSTFRSIDLDESEEQVKGTAGTLYGWYLFNAGEATVYVKLYNATAASVTVGETTPAMTIPVPAGSAANVEFTNGIAFSTAITAAATTGVADADTGAPATNAVIANLLFA